MKKSSRFAALTLTLLGFVSVAQPTSGAFVLTIFEVGSDVVATGSGTINLTALTPQFDGFFGPEISPNQALLWVGAGPIAGPNGSAYGGLTGPTSFGTMGVTAASSATGSFAGSFGQLGFLIVPLGYTSNTPLTGTATFSNKTFASLGFTPGTYTWTWGSGASADSLTVTSVPEPSTWALLGCGAPLAGVSIIRARRKASA